MSVNSIDWLGDIPKSWEITNVGRVFDNRNTKVSENDYSPLSVTMNGVVPQLDSAVKTNNKEDRKLIKSGDFVINSRSDRRGAYGIAPCDGCCSIINLVLSPKDKKDARFYEYVLQASSFPDEFYKWGYGIVSDLWTTRWDSMKRILLPCPPQSTREKIVEYLDLQCLKIDEAICKEEQLIDALTRLHSAALSGHRCGHQWPPCGAVATRN